MNEVILPDGWYSSKLENAISSQDLISDGDWIESKDQDINGTIRIIQLADIGDGEFKNKSERYITPEKAKTLKCTYLHIGDVLIARMPDPLGRSCIFPNIHQSAVTVVDICLIRTKNSAFNNKILKYWLNTPIIRSKIASNSSGTTRKRITRKKLEQLILPIPALPEQKVIADLLDQLIAQVDKLKLHLETILTTLKQFRQSVLNAAVTGKLTEDWRRSFNLSFDLKNLNNLKLDLLKNKYIKNDLIVDILKPSFKVPNSWIFLDLKSIATKITDGEHKTPKRQSHGKYLLSARNIQNSYIDLSNVDYVDEVEYQRVRKRCDPNKNDILISCSGSVGRICLVDCNNIYVMVRSVALIKTMDNLIENNYIMYALQSPLLQQQIEEKSKYTAQANLFLGQIKELALPIPSLEEQQKIVNRVENYFTFADKIEQQVKSAQERVNNLTPAILAKAFKGELTADWRAKHPELISGENSAEALLKRIQAEQETLTKPTKTKKVKK